MENNIRYFEDNKFFSLKELLESDYSYYKVKKMVEDGILVKLNRKYYESLLYKGEENDLLYVEPYIPKGIICLMSAAEYHNITNYRSFDIDVAVPMTQNIKKFPEYPIFQLYFFNKNRYSTGVEKLSINHNIKIYDIHKTVLDILYYKDKIGIEETKEIIHNYLNNDKKDLNILYDYAKKMNMVDKLRNDLELLI